MAKLFGIEPGDGVLIDYDRREGGGGDLRRSGDRGRGRGRPGAAGAETETETEAEGGVPGGSTEALPEAMQEELLLEDLLYALMGFAGRYVCVRPCSWPSFGGVGEGVAVLSSSGGIERFFLWRCVLGVWGRVQVCGACSLTRVFLL